MNKDNMRNIISGIVLLLVLSLSGQAEVYRIRSAEELTEIKFAPGDRVVLEQGNWVDQKLIFEGAGTAENPITLTVEGLGTVVLTGSSSLVIDGSWLVVDGLSFRDGYTLKENVVTFSEQSDNCRLTNTSIIDYNNPDAKLRNSWIVLYGFKNRVDHCYIKGKTHVGTTIGVYVSDKPNRHRIDHNFFDGRPPLGRNGGEIIRMGTDQWSMHDSYTVVEENIFAHCDGEIEIVSNKSTNNTIRNNLFYESVGMLTLRHGNKASVYGNYFIGNQKDGTGGIRIIGEDHKIRNNYLYGLTGTGLNAAITFMNAWENPPLYGYWQVKKVEVRNNTIIDCRESIVVGSGKNEKTFLPPLNTVITNNIIVTKTPIITWTEPTAKTPESITFENNIVHGTEKQDSYPEGIEVLDPKLTLNKLGVYEKNLLVENGIGAQSMKDIHVALLRAENIGPNWMKLKMKFEIKTRDLSFSAFFGANSLD